MGRTRTFGPAFVESLDGKRICAQLEKLRALMSDHQWRTLQEISDATGIPQASASSDLRHLRKERNGSYIVEKRRLSLKHVGTYQYRLLDPIPKGQMRLI